MKTILLFLIIAFATLPTKATSFYNVVDSTRFNQDSLNYEFDKKLKKFTSAKLFQDSLNYEAGKEFKKYTNNYYLGMVFNIAGALSYALPNLVGSQGTPTLIIPFVLIGSTLMFAAPMHIHKAADLLQLNNKKRKKSKNTN